MASKHGLLLDAAVTRLQSLSLGGLQTRVVRRYAVDTEEFETNLGLPAIVVTPQGIQGVDDVLTTNAYRGIALPVSVLLCLRADRQTDNPDILEWREAILAAFDRGGRTEPFASIPGMAQVYFTPGPTIEAITTPKYKLLVSGLTFSCIVQQA